MIYEEIGVLDDQDESVDIRSALQAAGPAIRVAGGHSSNGAFHMTSLVHRILPAVVVLCASFAPAIAQTDKSKLIREYVDWGVYSAVAGGKRFCFVMTQPRKKQPARLNHGDNYFFVTKRTNSPQRLEVNFLAGYQLKSESTVAVQIDGKKKYTLASRGDAAWIKELSEEQNLIDAMKQGRTMIVSAISRRNNKTRYELSLRGITEALESIESSCE